MLPRIDTNSKKNLVSQSAFLGLDISQIPSPNSFKDCLNVTSKNYPYIANRPPRNKYGNYNGVIQNMESDGSLYYIYTDDSGKHLFYNGKTLKISDATANKSYTARLPGKLLIMPEKKLYHINTNVVENIAKSGSFNGNTALEKCRREASAYVTGFDNVFIAEADKYGIHSRMINGSPNFYYIDFGTDFKEGEILNIKMNVWFEPADYSVKYYELINKFKEGINLELKGLTKTKHKSDNGEITEYTSLLFDENAISFDGYEDMYISSITVSREVPDLTDVCSYNNRMWGVTKNAIRTSKLGDPAEWNDYSQDSYGTLPNACFSCEVDTASDFTAICAFNGNILAFKENCIHKVYGNQPDNYTIVTIDSPGVQKGAKNTLAIINGALYYKGINGIYEYTTGSPKLVSTALGTDIGTAEYASTDGINYYIVLKKYGKSTLYCFNPIYKTWNIESIEQTIDFMCNFENNLYIAGGGIVLTNDKTCELYEHDMNWHFKLKYDENTYNRKCYTKLKLSYELTKDSYFYMYVYYDNDLIKKYAFSDFTCDEFGQAFVPLPHRGCKNISVLFKGSGNFKLKNLTREFIILNEGGK